MLFNVGYSVALGESSQIPTSLIFSINIPSTSGYEMVIRYLVNIAVYILRPIYFDSIVSLFLLVSFADAIEL